MALGHIIIGAIARSVNSLRVATLRTFRDRRSGISGTVFPRNTTFVSIVVLAAISTAISYWMFDADVIRYLRGNDEIAVPLYKFFSLVTTAGEARWSLLLCLLAGAVLSITDWKKLPRKIMLHRIGQYADLNFIFFNVAISGFLAWFIKNLIGRARPKLLEEFGPHYFDPAQFNSVYASFPSGHAATFGALAMALIMLLPRFKYIWMVFGIMGAFSRVFVGAHYISDILAGFAFGIVFVVLAARWLAQRGVMFKFTDGWLPKRSRPV